MQLMLVIFECDSSILVSRCQSEVEPDYEVWGKHEDVCGHFE
jgi:hypothetical protein